jgi:hypothetical protein
MPPSHCATLELTALSKPIVCSEALPITR